MGPEAGFLFSPCFFPLHLCKPSVSVPFFFLLEGASAQQRLVDPNLLFSFDDPFETFKTDDYVLVLFLFFSEKTKTFQSLPDSKFSLVYDFIYFLARFPTFLQRAAFIWSYLLNSWHCNFFLYPQRACMRLIVTVGTTPEGVRRSWTFCPLWW